MSASWTDTMENVTLDIPCPRCGKHEYTYTPIIKDDKTYFLNTVLWCKTNRGTLQLCPGKICYCKKCEKYYPESNFGFHNDAFECKECGQVQWDYTDLILQERRQSAMLNRIRSSMRDLY